jgi:Kef-type K+ transport system membrane component KefB
VTTDQVLFGVGLILVLAVGSQVLASRLRIPALIILLPAGFTAGAITTDVNPERLLGGREVDAERRHKSAIGFTGDPVPVGSRSGAMTHRNDQRPASSHSGTSSSNDR